jgi:hypothetical protein
MLKPDGTSWMADLQKMSPKLDWDDLAQRPALPLGSWLKVDPWSDQVHQLNAKIYAYMNARDKMPFEVTPVYFRLQRFEAATNPTLATVLNAAPPASAPSESSASPASANSQQVPSTEPDAPQPQPAATANPEQK